MLRCPGWRYGSRVRTLLCASSKVKPREGERTVAFSVMCCKRVTPRHGVAPRARIVSRCFVFYQFTSVTKQTPDLFEAHLRRIAGLAFPHIGVRCPAFPCPTLPWLPLFCLPSWLDLPCPTLRCPALPGFTHARVRSWAGGLILGHAGRGLGYWHPAQAKKEENSAKSPADLKFEEMQQYAFNLDAQVRALCNTTFNAAGNA